MVGRRQPLDRQASLYGAVSQTHFNWIRQAAQLQDPAKQQLSSEITEEARGRVPQQTEILVGIEDLEVLSAGHQPDDVHP